ncbi:hypothetical protein BDA99DRAFT_559500 [Phascolomyces articulosus]|uniref:Uncharacterized protein n=1 Tax=Phascolomyces articulosus TaxID=60185 RepID=A0AAD5KAH4_9FUNG|nr:hypothetical protein BDA99DRAFT_559500 [Phascolomyces articulosus]
MGEEKQFNLDAYSLDEWLENDLRASGILNDTHTQQRKQQGDTATTPSLSTTTTTTTTPLTNLSTSSMNINNSNTNNNDTKSSSLKSSITIATSSTTPSPILAPFPILFPPLAPSSSLKRSHEEQEHDDHNVRKRPCHIQGDTMASLETRVKDLEVKNQSLRIRSNVLESERETTLERQQKTMARIMELERQLAQAHEALLCQQACQD